MVCLADDSYIPNSPKQKLARRNKIIFCIYDEYFRDEDVFQYYYIIHNIDLYNKNKSNRAASDFEPKPSGVA